MSSACVICGKNTNHTTCFPDNLKKRIPVHAVKCHGELVRRHDALLKDILAKRAGTKQQEE